jgi:hypothetical protein
MFTKSLIAVAAVASVLSFASTAAQAEPTVTFGIGFGTSGYFPGDGYFDEYPRYPRHRRHHYRDAEPVLDYGVSCGEGLNVVREAGFRRVRAYDCSAPTYGYKAMRDGDFYRVKVNYSGDIISVRPIY